MSNIPTAQEIALGDAPLKPLKPTRPAPVPDNGLSLADGDDTPEEYDASIHGSIATVFPERITSQMRMGVVYKHPFQEEDDDTK